MDTNLDECMFCHLALAADEEETPINLAFMSHIQQRENCQDAFDMWTENMVTDHLG